MSDLLKPDPALPWDEGLTVSAALDAEKSRPGRRVYAVTVDGAHAGYVVGFSDRGHATLWGPLREWNPVNRHLDCVPSYRSRAQAAHALLPMDA